MTMLFDHWIEVNKCPVCGAPYSDATTSVNIPAAAIMAVTVGELTFPVSFSVVYNECAWCGMIFQNPTLDEKGLDEFYKQEGLYRELTKTRTEYTVEEERAARLIGAIEGMGVSSVLDIGCGHGELLKLCQDLGMDVQGIDMTPDHCIEGVPACGSMDELGGKKYDLVTMIHLLEHVTDPVGYLKQALEHASKYVMIEVPKYDIGDYKVRYLNLPHVLIFRTWTLADTMERAGIDVLSLTTFQRNIIAVGEVKGR